MRRPLPWWFAVGVAILVVVPILLEVMFQVRVPMIVVFAVLGVLFALSFEATVAPGRTSLEKIVAPAPVFAVEYDSGSRAVLESISGSRIPESSAFLVVQESGVDVWSIEREPQRIGGAPWSAFAAASSRSGPRRVGTAELELADGRTMWVDVRRGLIARIRGLGPSASELARHVEAHLSPAQPDAAHTPPRARSD